MGLYVETTESAAPTLLVLSQETILVRITLCGIDTTCHGLTAIEREQPGEPVAGNPLGGFCEGGRAQVTNPRDLSLPTNMEIGLWVPSFILYNFWFWSRGESRLSKSEGVREGS